MRRLALAALLALLTSLVVAPQASPGGPARVLEAVGRVTDIAAEGSRVAVAVGATARTCDRIAVWAAAKRRVQAWNARTNCPQGSQSHREGIVEVGISTQAVGWIETFSGNLQDLVLYAAAPNGAARRQIALETNGMGASGDPTGGYLGGLHGDGAVLVYNRWAVCVAYPPGWEIDLPPRPPCDEPVAGDRPVEVVHGEELRRVGGAEPVAEGDTSVIAQAVGGARVATRQADGAVSVLDLDGTPRYTLPPLPLPARRAAVTGALLVVQRPGTLEVYDAASGMLERTWSESRGRLADADGRLAVLVSGRRLTLIGLADGSAVAERRAPRRVVDAELEPAGLWYAWNRRSGPSPGRVAFVPRADLTG